MRFKVRELNILFANVFILILGLPLALSNNIQIDNLHHYINRFENSQIYLINYKGIDISERVKWPLIFMRYYVEYHSKLFVPVEPKYSTNCTSRQNVDRVALLQYTGMIDNPKLFMGKRIRHKVIIYLEPPSYAEDSSFYWLDKYALYFREPVDLNKYVAYEFIKYDAFIVNKIYRYFVLVKHITALDVNDDYTYVSWSLSLFRVFRPPFEHKYFIVLQMQQTTKPTKSFDYINRTTDWDWIHAGKSCGQPEYQWQFVGITATRTGWHFGHFQTTGLMLHRSHLRFVSCHFEQVYWVYNFRKLVDTFDIQIWIAFFVCVFLTSYVTKFATRVYIVLSSDGPTRVQFKRKSFIFVCSSLISLVLDQGTDYLDWSSVRSKVFYFPLAIWNLGNEHKGHTITELTVPPPLVPFDTFERLVANHFNIYSVPRTVAEVALGHIGNIGGRYHQTNAHEAFPVVSESWMHIMYGLGTSWRRFSDIYIDLKTQLYLNHSELFPSWHKYNFADSIHSHIGNELVGKHMETCRLSAVIRNEHSANILIKQLQRQKFPAYLGREVIHEFSHGYIFWYPVSQKVFLETRNFFESGIMEWWRKCIDDLIARVLLPYNLTMPSGTASDSARQNSDIKVLSVTPGVGILIALAVFLIEIIKGYRLVRGSNDRGLVHPFKAKDEHVQQRRTSTKFVRRERRHSYVINHSDISEISEANETVEEAHSSQSSTCNALKDKCTKTSVCRSCGGSGVQPVVDWWSEAKDGGNVLEDLTEEVDCPNEPVFRLNKHVVKLLEEEIQELRNDLRKRKLENRLLKDAVKPGTSTDDKADSHFNNDIDEILNCNL